ncbi:MAG: DUF2318 domain-containing protein [Gammaproteobacteria bacterium]|nr:MAG: DUF2318 domain-containing protein [Gammaproteobacteria bacterium]
MSERESKREQFQNNASGGGGKKVAIVALALLVVAGVAGWLLFGPAGAGGVRSVQADNGAVRLKAADFEDGKARFFEYNGRSGPIRFFVVKSTDGVIRAAFDACDVCYREKKGYTQVGDSMICNNCGQSFPTDRVNVVKGGCNPSPLPRQLANGQVIITVAALEQGATYF